MVYNMSTSGTDFDDSEMASPVGFGTRQNRTHTAVCRKFRAKRPPLTIGVCWDLQSGIPQEVPLSKDYHSVFPFWN